MKSFKWDCVWERNKGTPRDIERERDGYDLGKRRKRRRRRENNPKKEKKKENILSKKFEFTPKLA
jgi:hypothetical protein